MDDETATTEIGNTEQLQHISILFNLPPACYGSHTPGLRLVAHQRQQHPSLWERENPIGCMLMFSLRIAED